MCENTYVNIQTGEVLDMGRVVSLKENAMLKHRPDLWITWDFNKNAELGIDIWKTTKGSGKKAYFKCLKCDNYNMQFVKNKVNGSGCSICLGKIPSKNHNLGVLYPELAKEWHPTLNGDLTPYDITPSSEKHKVWWLCDKNHHYDSLVGDRKIGNGCPYCINKRVWLNFNNVGFTHPHIIPLLLNPEDGNKYTFGSAQKVKFKCECGNVLNKPLISVINQGLCCPKCSDGVSFGEKLMYHLLKENHINFKYDSTTEFSKGKRYDFILDDYSTIIEINGEQHFSDRDNSFGKFRALKDEIENDVLKRNLAISNGYINYYSIEISNRNIEMFSENVKASGLLKLLNIESVNWDEISLKSVSSLIIDVCKTYDKNPNYSTGDIVEQFKLSDVTIRRYLKLGNELGICSYSKNTSNHKIRSSKKNYRQS